jgi:acetyltransferase-like isoleucine patch superfamily enzyme
MIKIPYISNLIRRLGLKIMLRKQFTSQSLRKYYARNFGITAGLYTYGCFDEKRINPGVTFGRYCSIAGSARVFTRNHPIHAISMHPILYNSALGLRGIIPLPFENLKIEDDVWIGHNAIILPSVKFIGRGSVIGAGSIVTHDVPAYAVVAGNPARLIKMRFNKETIERIEKSRWWEYSIEEFIELFKEKSDLFPFPKTISLTTILE